MGNPLPDGHGAFHTQAIEPKNTLRADILASVVVFLVALPLCLGIAIASGAPAVLGLISGMVGGIVTGLFSGSPLQVSGPAAGLVALVAEAIQEHGIESLGVIVLIGGALQILAGVFQLGQWFRAIAPAVIQGMLAGIGVLIMASQFHVMLDVHPESSGLANLISIPETIQKGLFPTEDTYHHWAAMLGLLTISVILIWDQMPKKLKLVPAALMAVLTAVIAALVFDLPVRYVAVPTNFFAAIPMPNPSHWLTMLQDRDLWSMGITIAIVASAESMLCASAVDLLLVGPRTQYNKELVAQGIGNMVAGFFGALPITGVIVRSSANVQAGAKTRLSAILHGIWILGLVAFFPGILQQIPTSSLAAVLVYTGYKLVQPAAIRKLARAGYGELLIYVVTLGMVVCTNLLEGVIAGLILSLAKLLITISHLEGQSLADHQTKRVDLILKGSATFLSLPTLITILERQPLGQELHVHLDQLNHIDHACLELLQSWEKQYQASGGQFIVEWKRWHTHTEPANCH